MFHSLVFALVALLGGKYVVVQPERGPSVRVFNRPAKQVEIQRAPGASRRELQKLVRSADAVAVKSAALVPRTDKTVYLGGDRLSPPERLGAAKAPRNQGLVRNPQLAAIG